MTDIVVPEFVYEVEGVIVTPVGSRRTCDPPPMDTDDDWLVYVPSRIKYGKLQKKLIAEGWFRGGSVQDPDAFSTFAAFKNHDDDVNLIVTTNKKFHENFLIGTELAKRFNLLKKEDRQDLFKAIRGEYVRGERPETGEISPLEEVIGDLVFV